MVTGHQGTAADSNSDPTDPAETRRQVGGPAVLESLQARIPLLSGPSPVHDDVAEIESAVGSWAADAGLDGTSTFGTLASYCLPDAAPTAAVLFGQWAAWSATLHPDRQALAADGRSLPELFEAWLAACSAGAASRDRDPGHAAGGLWQRTRPLPDGMWARRFRYHLRQHQRARAQQAHYAALRRIPAPDRYPALRRAVNCPWLFDLPEVLLGVPVPADVYRSNAWRALVHGVNDVTAWCQDIAAAEAGSGVTWVVNHVMAVAQQARLPLDAAAERVVRRIEVRCGQMEREAERLPEVFSVQSLASSERDGLVRLAQVLLGYPRAYLEWTTVV